MIAPNVIILWSGNHADIPAGFTRATEMDGLFVKASGSVAPNVGGGAATHSHTTAAAHSHTMDNHTHVCTVPTIGSSGSDSDSGGSELTAEHSHTPSVGGVNSGGLSSISATYSSFSNNPPYYEIIFIKATSWKAFPASAVCLWNSASPPTGFNLCDGNSGTPDLRDKFLKGATTGANAGGTGGSYTNIHTLTHTNTESSHYHYETLRQSGDVPGGCRRGRDSGDKATCSHDHRYYLDANTAGGISTPTLTTSETVQPSYKKIAAIKNSATAVLPTKGIIGMWLGTVSSIPAGWFICDGTQGTPDLRDYFPKIINTTGELGTTGGSNTHNHASQSHTHSGNAHSHTYNSGSSSLCHNLSGGQSGVGGGWGILNNGNCHNPVTSVASGSASWASSSTSSDTQDNQPLYKTAAFIQYQYVPGGALIFQNL